MLLDVGGHSVMRPIWLLEVSPRQRRPPPPYFARSSSTRADSSSCSRISSLSRPMVCLLIAVGSGLICCIDWEESSGLAAVASTRTLSCVRGITASLGSSTSRKRLVLLAPRICRRSSSCASTAPCCSRARSTYACSCSSVRVAARTSARSSSQHCLASHASALIPAESSIWACRSRSDSSFASHASYLAEVPSQRASNSKDLRTGNLSAEITHKSFQRSMSRWKLVETRLRAASGSRVAWRCSWSFGSFALGRSPPCSVPSASCTSRWREKKKIGVQQLKRFFVSSQTDQTNLSPAVFGDTSFCIVLDHFPIIFLHCDATKSL